MLERFDERNRDILINVDGELHRRDEAGISPFDSAVQGGDAVWEGMRVYDGRVYRLKEHLKRLRGSAQALAYDRIPSFEALMEEIRRTLEANDMRDGICVRLTLTRGVKVTSGMDPRLIQGGPTLIVLAEHAPPPRERGGVALITSSIRCSPPDCLDPKIHHCNLLQSTLAKIEANCAGVEDALMLDNRGFLAETSAAHAFIVTDGVVETGRLVACREGITREAVLEICQAEDIPHAVRDLTLTEAYRAHEVFCTDTLSGVWGVTRVDGRIIGSGEVGPLTRRLSSLYQRRAASEGIRVV